MVTLGNGVLYGVSFNMKRCLKPPGFKVVQGLIKRLEGRMFHKIKINGLLLFHCPVYPGLVFPINLRKNKGAQKAKDQATPEQSHRIDGEIPSVFDGQERLADDQVVIEDGHQAVQGDYPQRGGYGQDQPEEHAVVHGMILAYPFAGLVHAEADHAEQDPENGQVRQFKAAAVGSLDDQVVNDDDDCRSQSIADGVPVGLGSGRLRLR